MTAQSTIRNVVRSGLSIYILLANTSIIPLTVSAQTSPDSSVVWHNRQTYIARVIRLISFQEISSGSRLELKPYVLTGRYGSRSWLHEHYSEMRYYKEEKAGLDARLMLGSEFIIDATLNTDFVQVEDDLEQIQIDRFPLFFPEKREYFSKNHDLFTFRLGENNAPPPFQLFYSRRIGLATSTDGGFFEVPISGSLRMTGKDGPWSIGALTVRTERVNHRLNPAFFDPLPPGCDGCYHRLPTCTYGVIRISRDIPKGSRIGAMLLGTNPGSGGVPGYPGNVLPERYRAGGVDASISLFRNTQLSGFLAGSRRSDGKTVPAASLNYLWNSDRWEINLINLYVDEDWVDDMGFVLRTGTLRNTVELSWSPHLNIPGLGQVVFFADTDYFTRPSGRLESRSFSPGVKLLLKNGGQVVLGGDARYEYIDNKFWLGENSDVGVSPDVYRWIDGFLSVSTSAAAPVGANATLAGGPYYNADRSTLFGTLWCQPVPSLRFEGQFFLNSIQRRPPWGDCLYEGEVLASRITWKPTTYTLVRLFTQMNTVTDIKIVNLLVALRYKPRSWLYLVWKDVIEREFYMWDWHSTDRVLLLKLTYLWNL